MFGDNFMSLRQSRKIQRIHQSIGFKRLTRSEYTLKLLVERWTQSRGLLVLFALLMVRISACQTPSPVWSLATNCGTVAISPTGNQVVISNAWSVEMLSYPGYQLQWTRRLSLQNDYPHNSFFSSDGSKVWIWYNGSPSGGSGSLMQVYASSGIPTGLNFPLPSNSGVAVYGSEIVVMQNNQGPQNYTVTYLTFDTTTLQQLASFTSSPGNNQSGTSFGSWNGNDALAINNQIWYLRTGNLQAQITSIGGNGIGVDGTLNIHGFDPGGGVIASIFPNNGSIVLGGTDRLVPDSNGNPVLSWNNSSYYVSLSPGQIPLLYNAFNNSLMIWQDSTYSGILGLNWQTGAQAWSGQTLPLTPAGDSTNISANQIFPNGHWLGQIGPIGWNNGYFQPTLVDYTINSAGISVNTPPNIPEGGIFQIAATSTGVILGGNQGGANGAGGSAGSNTYLGFQNSADGSVQWSNQAHSGAASPRLAPSGNYVVVCNKGTPNNASRSDSVVVYQASSGNTLATLIGSPANWAAASFWDAVWADDSLIVALDHNWNAYSISFNGSQLGTPSPLNVAFVYGCAIGWVAGTDGSGNPTITHYAVGFTSGTTFGWLALDGTAAGTLTTIPAYVPNQTGYRITPMSNGAVSILQPLIDSTGWTGLAWFTYQMSSSGQINLVDSFIYTSPNIFNDQGYNNPAVGYATDGFANGDISLDGRIVAFAEGEGVDETGNVLPSQLQIVRTSDGAVLQTINNYFTGITNYYNWYNIALMAFSPDDTILYVADAFGDRVTALPVPTWSDAVSTVAIHPTTVVGGSGSSGTVTLSKAAPVGGDVVNLTSSDPSTVVPTTVMVPAGQTSTTFAITTTAVSTNTLVTITATSGSVNASTVLTVTTPSVNSVSLNPTSVVGGSTSTGTVTLNGPAGPSGDTILLTSSNTAMATVPASVTISAGSTSATFTVTSIPDQSTKTANIVAALGSSTQFATLTVNPPALSSITLTPNSLVGGNKTVGTVTLSGPAAVGGVGITLSSNSTNAPVQSSLTILAGLTSANFTITTTAVGSTVSATITATHGSASLPATLTIIPASLITVSLSPATVLGGSSSNGAVTLNGVAAAGGATVSLSSNSSNAALPPSVTIPAGASSATFTVATTGVAATTSVTITGTLNGVTQTGTLTINAPSLVSLGLIPTSVIGGTPSTGTVTLNGPAPATGLPVSLSSNNPTYASVPTSVTVAGGSTTGTFTVSTTPDQSAKTATITCTLGSVSKTATLTVTAPVLASFTVSPASVIGGSKSVGTVTLSGPAATGGVGVTLSSNSTSATIQSQVTVLAGATTATVSIGTVAIPSTVVATISAAQGGISLPESLTVQAAGLISASVSPNAIVGGSATKVTGTVSISGPAPVGGATVGLSSSNTSAATVPTSVTIPAGSTTATYPVATLQVSATTTPTVTATYNGVTLNSTLTVNPYQATSIAASPSTILGGDSTAGTVTINAAAPTGGIVVNLTSNSSAMAVPASVTIPAGSTSVAFSATTIPVLAATNVTIQAAYGSQTPATASATVDPPAILVCSFVPDTVPGGAQTTLYVFLTGATAPGATLNVTCNSTRLTVGTTLTCVAGMPVQFFTLPTIAGAPTTVQLTLTTNGSSSTSILTLTP